MVMDNLACNDTIQIEKRKHQRYSIPSVVTCNFVEGIPEGKRRFEGFLQDISLGGVFLEIKDDFLHINESVLPHSTIEMVMECTVADGIEMMAVSGTIKWFKRIQKPSGSFLYLRIQFHTLDEMSLDTLKEFLSLGTGDKQLFWNLWETVQP